jgi:MFS family permease
MSPGRSLDLFNMLVSSVQTGFGPFVAVYLASEAWTQREIGTALSLGTLAGMLSQVPAGALVDAARSKRTAALVACLAVAASALLLAFWPDRLPVLGAEVLHGFASCMLGPAIAAISLRLVGHAGLGERLGRNARFAAIGSGVAAAVMGWVGTYVQEAAVFWLTAVLMLPALVVLRMVRQPAIEPGAVTPRSESVWRLLLDHRLLLFALCMALFQLGNAAVLPLVGAALTRTTGSSASLVIAACIILPQGLMALVSPRVGHAADRWGRRPVLLLALAALPVRAVLLAWVQHPALVAAIQLLDGISAAGLGVLVPLIAADLTRGTNRFNLCMGLLGLAVGLGATVSTTLAGTLADAYGPSTALLALGGAGLLATAAAALVPETRQVVPAQAQSRT